MLWALLKLIVVVIGLALLIYLIALPGVIARRKGRSLWGFIIFSVFLWLPALIVALVISPREIHRGDIVRTNVAAGGIQSGTAAKVNHIDVHDGVPSVMLETQQGAVWLPIKQVRKA